jgi:hypothetical protein
MLSSQWYMPPCALYPSVIIALVADTEVFCKFWEVALVGIPITGIFGCTPNCCWKH